MGAHIIVWSLVQDRYVWITLRKGGWEARIVYVAWSLEGFLGFSETSSWAMRNGGPSKKIEYGRPKNELIVPGSRLLWQVNSAREQAAVTG
jgi:hypothetical protein